LSKARPSQGPRAAVGFALVPPQTTRARIRGEFIRQANLKGKDYRADWVFLKLNDPERETILCKDPFQSHDERVERLIRLL
jgi:proteasome accessory factor A